MSAQDIADAAGIAVTLVRRLLRTPERRPARNAPQHRRGDGDVVWEFVVPEFGAFGQGVGLESSRGAQNAVFRAYRYSAEQIPWLWHRSDTPGCGPGRCRVPAGSGRHPRGRER
ncbi:hypothetical protein [Kitasatospora sp. DSM 101779]|uniref:hypothetical protein n=1 Tax=Kitasatospora sp. DSM 101779 TaxID=2853165 RepID=UPI0021DB041E|nr:hypothetical protein [Kitasatospora sp. DSM 101779]MCU7820304.1 hypothetical protein [Kitasatospora sp. DSM 101779]